MNELFSWFIGIGFFLAFLVLAGVIIFFIFWIKAIVEIITCKNKSDWKIIWLLVIIFLHAIGLILYYILAHKEAKIK
jgi:formate hydrogenlyase subunit 3/multisubunit Na+/H+ antiporter MnhD subunit